MRYYFYIFLIIFLMGRSVLQAAEISDTESAFTVSEKSQFNDEVIKRILISEDVEKLETLVKNGFDINSRDENGDTILIYALQNNADIAMVKKIIGLGADVNSPSAQSGVTPLIIATQTAAIFQDKAENFLVMQKGEDLVRKSIVAARLKETAISDMMRAEKLVDTLVKNGADVNQETPYGTPLMNAVTNEWNFGIVDKLLKAGADVNQQNRSGKTALFYAFAYECNKMVTLLLEVGADTEIKDNNGYTYIESEKSDIINR